MSWLSLKRELAYEKKMMRDGISNILGLVILLMQLVVSVIFMVLVGKLASLSFAISMCAFAAVMVFFLLVLVLSLMEETFVAGRIIGGVVCVTLIAGCILI